MNTLSLFCGCGGLDLGFVEAGYDIIWSNDFDKYAVQTYNANKKYFKHDAVLGDINEVNLDDLPDFDVLIGGFPCQPFSTMGHELGFEDTRGTLFFRIAEIIKHQIDKGRPPKAIILENVKGLRTHDKGNTFRRIKEILEKDLKLKVFDDVLNTADYGLPQTRNRTYIVAFTDPAAEFHFPETRELQLTMQDLLEDENEVDDKYFLSERILKTILAPGTKNFHAKSEIDLPVARPLCATMAKMHRACQDNYVTQKGKVRRLTPRECARLQGFPEDFVFPVSNCQAYKQLGNAVSVKVAYEVAKEVLNTLATTDKK